MVIAFFPSSYSSREKKFKNIISNLKPDKWRSTKKNYILPGILHGSSWFFVHSVLLVDLELPGGFSFPFLLQSVDMTYVHRFFHRKAFVKFSIIFIFYVVSVHFYFLWRHQTNKQFYLSLTLFLNFIFVVVVSSCLNNSVE